MEYLYQNSYISVFPEELNRFDKSRKLFMLTFDDGYLSFMDYAFPVLRDYGFKAIINVIGAYVGSYYNFNGKRPTLSWDDYRFLISSGLVRVGYHGYDIHVTNWVNRFTPEQLRLDSMKFLDKLNKELGTSTDIFAAPYGQYSERHLDVLRKLGFKYFFTSEERLFGMTDMAIPRLNINNSIDLVSFSQYIGGDRS
ncbi:polysaccharide deacetylase family protein [Hydrogenobacter sp. Uz 6-8]|uniref:polysaccharide deacetylase family protein n=1 Tax=Hydrogenobacter sp. Uz 6-8 TaxID=3384828 RepID=UPI0038FC0399